MAILRYMLPASLALLLCSCYEEFSPDIAEKSVLCLNSEITAGEPVKVNVTHTWKYNQVCDEANRGVPDARVCIFANDVLVGKDYLPKEGDNIRIEAGSAIYGEASAEVEVPVAAPIVPISVRPVLTERREVVDDSYSVRENYLRFNLHIELNLNDIPDVANYFRFGYYWDSPSIRDDNAALPLDLEFSIGSFEYNLEPIFSEHVGTFETAMGNGDDVNFPLFSDGSFADKDYTLHLNFSDNYLYIKSTELNPDYLDCGLTLYINTVSKSYYDWYVYKWNEDEGTIESLSELGLAESKWGYSNVTTGAGVVAAKSSRAIRIPLRDFLFSALSEVAESYE